MDFSVDVSVVPQLVRLKSVFLYFEPLYPPPGMTLIKDDPALFKGLFLMAIKDVGVTDVEDLKEEFWGKIERVRGGPEGS